MDGRLSWLQFTRTQVVTHPSSNPAVHGRELNGLTENAGRENDGPKMTTGREMAGEKSTVSTEITLQ